MMSVRWDSFVIFTIDTLNIVMTESSSLITLVFDEKWEVTFHFRKCKWHHVLLHHFWSLSTTTGYRQNSVKAFKTEPVITKPLSKKIGVTITKKIRDSKQKFFYLSLRMCLVNYRRKYRDLLVEFFKLLVFQYVIYKSNNL